MSCTMKTQDNSVSSDAKLQDKVIPSKETSDMETSNKGNSTPPIPMIPEDDMDESEEGFPLITSVFSLASDSSDSQKSSEKESTKMTSSKDTSSTVSVSTGGSPTANRGNVSQQLLKMLARGKPKPAVVDNKPGQNRDNAPYYVGKGKLILPKPKVEDNQSQATIMMTFSPQTNTAVNSKSNVGKESTGQAPGMMTRSAAHKINPQQPNGQVGSSAPRIAAQVYPPQSISASSTSTSQPQVSSQPQVVKLGNKVQLVNVKSPPGKATFPVLTPHTSSGSAVSASVLGSSSPLVKLIKSISPNSTLTNLRLTPATTVTNTPQAPVVTPAASTPAVTQVRSQRHINIAPAPVQQIVATTPPINTGNTTRIVVVPKTGISSPTIPVTQVVSAKGGVNLPKVVMLPNNSSTQGTTPPTQVLYLVENQGAGEGKTFRLVIPERKVAGQTAITVPSQSPLTIVSANNGSIVSHTQLVRIIPKPVTTTAGKQQPKIPIATQTTSPSVVNPNVSKAAPVLKNGSTMTDVSPQNISEESPTTSEDSSYEIPASPNSPEEAKPSVESIDTGLSPHEARIQKLKELLRKQEEAIDRLKQKRQQEIEDVRAPPADSSNFEGAAIKRDSPFVVPLPPKKARLEQYRSKLKETNTTVKDGFLPNTDDTQFVKLVGLEKVVDKLKAKKMQELEESQTLYSQGVDIMPS